MPSFTMHKSQSIPTTINHHIKIAQRNPFSQNSLSRTFCPDRVARKKGSIKLPIRERKKSSLPRAHHLNMNRLANGLLNFSRTFVCLCECTFREFSSRVHILCSNTSHETTARPHVMTGVQTELDISGERAHAKQFSYPRGRALLYSRERMGAESVSELGFWFDVGYGGIKV